MRKRHASIPRWIATCGAILGFLGAGPVDARSPGIDTPQMLDGPVTCSGIICHGPADTGVSVTIAGPEFLDLNETAGYTVAISNVPMGQLGAGLGMAVFLDEILTGAEEGILGEDSDDLQLTAPGVGLFTASGQLTHVVELSVTELTGIFAYDFSVTAPSTPGTLELRGAMNAFDGGFPGNLNDNWNSASHFVTVPEPGVSVLAAAALLSLAVLRKWASC